MNHDLVDIDKVNSRIILDIRYATENNFTKTKVYSHAKCYLRPAVAYKLHNVQQELETMNLGLKIWDAYRPHHVSHIFWQLIQDERYVARPELGSNHNRGAAVDLTLVTPNGQELLMPTEFDDFTHKAHRDYNDLHEEAINNRELLEKIMIKHGFTGLPTEWWHFDCTEAKNYDILNIAFHELI